MWLSKRQMQFVCISLQNIKSCFSTMLEKCTYAVTYCSTVTQCDKNDEGFPMNAAYDTWWNCITRLAAFILRIKESHCDGECFGTSRSCCCGDNSTVDWVLLLLSRRITAMPLLLPSIALQELLIRHRSRNRSCEKWSGPEALIGFIVVGEEDTLCEFIFFLCAKKFAGVAAAVRHTERQILWNQSWVLWWW